eukprot:15436337-Alexandrium_andersonii.AAC.1
MSRRLLPLNSPPRATTLASLHCKVPTVQSAIHPRPVRAAIRPNPQSAMRNMQTRFTRSNLELHGHKNGLEI